MIRRSGQAYAVGKRGDCEVVRTRWWRRVSEMLLELVLGLFSDLFSEFVSKMFLGLFSEAAADCRDV